MDSIQPWLDPIEVRRLADRLMNANRESDLPAGLSAGIDGELVDYAATRPVFPDRPQPAPASSPEAQATASEPLLERITGFRNWLHEHFSATGVFILDQAGTVLFNESGHGRLHFLARSLALTSHRPNALVGNVHVKIRAGASVEIIPMETSGGWFVLGAVVPAALDPAAVRRVMDALRQALES